MKNFHCPKNRYPSGPINYNNSVDQCNQGCTYIVRDIAWSNYLKENGLPSPGRGLF